METHEINNTQNSNLHNDNLADVNNPGHSQAQEGVQTSVEQSVQTQPGPDAAFAAMRQENERLAKEAHALKNIAEDEGVKQFLAQREATRRAEEAAKQNLSVEAVQRLEAIEAQQKALVEQQTQAAAAHNLQSFAKSQAMDATVLNAFANWMDKSYPEMANMAAANPSFDFAPYAALYAQTVGATPVVPSTPATPVFIPGHGSATSANTKSEDDRQMAIIRELAKD